MILGAGIGIMSHVPQKSLPQGQFVNFVYINYIFNKKIKKTQPNPIILN